MNALLLDIDAVHSSRKQTCSRCLPRARPENLGGVFVARRSVSSIYTPAAVTSKTPRSALRRGVPGSHPDPDALVTSTPPLDPETVDAVPLPAANIPSGFPMSENSSQASASIPGSSGEMLGGHGTGFIVEHSEQLALVVGLQRVDALPAQVRTDERRGRWTPDFRRACVQQPRLFVEKFEQHLIDNKRLTYGVLIPAGGLPSLPDRPRRDAQTESL